MRVLHLGDPRPHGLVDCVLQGPRPCRHGVDGRPEQLHAEDVELLALRVDLAHVDRALESEQRRSGRGGDAVLTGPRLGDHLGLAHPLGQQGLPDDVVELVRTRVREIFSLEQQGDAEVLREPMALGHRRRSPAEGPQDPSILLDERRVVPRLSERLLELLTGWHQGLGDESPSKRPEPPGRPRVSHDRHVSSSSSRRGRHLRHDSDCLVVLGVIGPRRRMPSS